MPSVPSPTPSWRADIAARMRRHLLLKLVGTTAWVWVFFVGYFHLLRHPAHLATVVPLTPLDAWIPFVPAMIVPYLSLWFYVGIAPGLQRNFAELLSYGLWSGLLCAAGLAIFQAFPTRIPPMTVDAGGFPGFALMQGIDAPGNACPSMHVAIAVFTAIWIDHHFRACRVPGWLRVANWAWFVAITFSTVAVRQHVVLDATAGALLGMVFAWPSLRWRPERVFRRAIMRGPPSTDGDGGTAWEGRHPEKGITDKNMGIAR